MIYVEKRKRQKTGEFGRYGLVAIRYEAWCVMEDGKVVAECSSEKAAKRLARMMPKPWPYDRDLLGKR